MQKTKLKNTILIALSFLILHSFALAQPQPHDHIHSFDLDEFQTHLQEAAEAFNQGHNVDAHLSFQAALEMTKILFTHQQWKSSIPVFEEWLDRYESIFPGDTMNTITPESFLALAMAHTHQYETAILKAQQVTQALENNPTLTREMAATLYLNCGNTALLVGRMDLAQQWLSSALSLSDKLPNEYFILRLQGAKAWVEYLVKSGQIPQARAVSDKLVKLLRLTKEQDPNLIEAFAALNQAHKIRTYPGANYKEVADLMGYTYDLLVPYLGQGDRFLIQLTIERCQALVLHQNQWTTMRHLMEQSLENMDNYPVFYRDLRGFCHGNLAIGLSNLGDYERAETQFLMGIQLLEEDSVFGGNNNTVLANFCNMMVLLGREHELCK